VPGVMTHVVIDTVGMPIIVAVWLFLAWAISRGRDAARFAFTSFFLLLTMGVIIALAQGAAVYAPADMIAGAAAWFVALVAVVLIFVPASNRYFRQVAAPVAHPAG
jgi:ABC-type maltose transport system permease subunit